MKKILALTLALLMSAAAFAGCGEKEKETQGEVNKPVDTSGTEPEETQKPTPNWDAVDKTGLDGMIVNILSANEKMRIDFENYTSDILENAVFERNRLIEQTLDCQINLVEIASGDSSSAVIERAVSAGDGSVDLGTASPHHAGILMTNGSLVPFNYIQELDMTQPWWDETLLADKSLKGMYYFGMLDFMFDHYDDMTVMFYNKTMLENYQLLDPYDLHKRQEWTIDKFVEMVEAATDDTNGDGIMDAETDDFGVYMEGSEGMPMIHMSGLKMIDWDPELETFVLNMGTERYLAVLEAITPIYSSLGISQGKEETFNSGNLLFLSTELGSFEQLRESEDSYGLIMCPRYDYTGEAFVTACGTPIVLPRDIGDDNKDGTDDYAELGRFIQAIGAYTYDVLVDIYKEKNVVGKGLRDEHSAEMFYEMIEMRGAEMCIAYFQTFGFAGTVNTQTDLLFGSGSGYASAAQSHQKKFDAYAKRLTGLIEDEIEKLGLGS